MVAYKISSSAAGHSAPEKAGKKMANCFQGETGNIQRPL